MVKIANCFGVSLLHFVDEDINWYDNLSPQFKSFINEDNIEYLSIVARAQKEGVKPEDLNAMVDFLNKVK